MLDPGLMSLLRDLALNVVASFILVVLIYFPRHRRRDLLVGLLAVNLSLFAVAESLSASASITVGVGFGLFAVLSIVRLRSDEASQIEIGYSMVSLALGLLNGLPDLPFQYKILFSTLLVVGMFAYDHPLLVSQDVYERFRLTLDFFSNDKHELVKEVERLTSMKVMRLSVVEFTMRNGEPRTIVDVRVKRIPGTEVVSVRRTPQDVPISSEAAE